MGSNRRGSSLKFREIRQVKDSSRGEVLHPEHVQRDEVGSVVAEQLAELIAVHESAAGHIEVGNSPKIICHYLNATDSPV